MFKFQNIIIILIFLLPKFVLPQTDVVTYEKVKSYKDWGWEALVIQNQYFKTAIVPSMGASILQYDFGTDTFLLLNPATYGKIYIPYKESPFNGDWGFGGSEVWPAPEIWPPPPVLTFGQYSDTVLFSNEDSVSVLCKGGAEIGQLKGLKLEKKFTANRNSTCLKLESKFVNTGTKTLNYGFMNAAYVKPQHADKQDYNNFREYYPIKANSKFGKTGARQEFSSTPFSEEVVPGIYTCSYPAFRSKLFIDVPEGWVAFVDELDKQAYIRIFDVFEGENYPDDGARLEIYNDGTFEFTAIEVMGPVKEILPDGGSYTFTEYLCSTRLGGPVLKASLAGAVSERMAYDSLTNSLSGTFGVFNDGELQLCFLDENRNFTKEIIKYKVKPNETFILKENLKLPFSTKIIELQAFNNKGELVGILDDFDLTNKNNVGIYQSKFNENRFIINKNYLKSGECLDYQLNNTGNSIISIQIFNSFGNKVGDIFEGKIPHGNSRHIFNLNHLNSGIYFVVFTDGKIQISKKIIVL